MIDTLRTRWLAHQRLRRFERAYGDIDVGAERAAEHAEPDLIAYIASDPGWLQGAFERLRPTSEDVFVDLGAGKGSALLVAAEQPFARVIGVELVPKLAAIARINLDHTKRPRRCKQVEVVAADAAAWPIPPDATIVYLFSPFVGATLAQVGRNIVASHDARPRTLHVVYACPHAEAALTENGRLELVDRFEVPAPPRVQSDVAIYRVA